MSEKSSARKTPAKAGQATPAKGRELAIEPKTKPRKKASQKTSSKIESVAIPIREHRIVPVILAEFRDKWVLHTEPADGILFTDKLDKVLDAMNDGVGLILLEDAAAILDKVKFSKDITAEFNSSRYFFLAMRLLRELNEIAGSGVRAAMPMEQAAIVLTEEWDYYKRMQRF